jgi:hypothetical protein
VRVVRLAFLTVAAGLLMAPGLGSTSVGDSSATLPIGDVPVGIRGGGCPAFAATPSVHVGLRFESYADNDPVTALADQGTDGVDFAQGTGSKQPTAKIPCESGKLNGQACAQGDGGDFINTGTVPSPEAQPSLVCGVILRAAADNSSNVTFWTGTGGTTEHDLTIFGNEKYAAVAGLTLAEGTGSAVDDQYVWVCMHINGASSEVWVNGSSVVTGNAGADQWRGAGLFARWSETQHISGKIAEWLYYDDVSTASTMVANVGSVWDCIYGSSWPQNIAPTGSASGDVTTTDVSVPKAVKRYARRLAQRGATPMQIGVRVRDGLVKRGYSVEEATELGRAMAKAARGRKGRDVDTLHTVRVGLATRPATAAAHGALIADALCRPLIDEDGAQDPAAAACLAAESQYMGERWCVAGTQTVALRGARAWLTADDYAAVSDVVRDTTGLRGVRDADDATYAAFMQDAADRLPGSPTVERCVGAP